MRNHVAFFMNLYKTVLKIIRFLFGFIFPHKKNCCQRLTAVFVL